MSGGGELPSNAACCAALLPSWVARKVTMPSRQCRCHRCISQPHHELVRPLLLPWKVFITLFAVGRVSTVSNY